MKYEEIGLCCEYCSIAIANDDYTGMDDETELRIRAGIWNHGPNLIVGEDQGFCRQGCDICGDGLGGNKHTVGKLY